MKKKLALSLLPALLLLSPLVSADTCPDASTIVWQNNMWVTQDGKYYGISEYSAGQSTPATTFKYAFYKDASPNGTVVCGYNTTDPTQDIEMMHYQWTIQKPTTASWSPIPPPGWHGNSGLICSGSSQACLFVDLG